MDYTLPVAGSVAIQAPIQSDTTNMNFTWSGFSDNLSGVEKYEVSIELWSYGPPDSANRNDLVIQV